MQIQLARIADLKNANGVPARIADFNGGDCIILVQE